MVGRHAASHQGHTVINLPSFDAAPQSLQQQIAQDVQPSDAGIRESEEMEREESRDLISTGADFQNVVVGATTSTSPSSPAETPRSRYDRIQGMPQAYILDNTLYKVRIPPRWIAISPFYLGGSTFPSKMALMEENNSILSILPCLFHSLCMYTKGWN